MLSCVVLPPATGGGAPLVFRSPTEPLFCAHAFPTRETEQEGRRGSGTEESLLEMSLYGGSVVSRLSKRSAIRYVTGSKITCVRR